MEQTMERIVPVLRIRNDWRLVGLVVAIKVALALLGGFVYQYFKNDRLTTVREWLEIWNIWDAPHYLDIAAYGYQNTGELRLWLVFYPLFPWLTRLFGWPFDDYLVGAFLVSTIASVVMALVFYRLVRVDEPAGVAWRSVWFLLLFPTGYVLHIGYTESLFLALAFGCLLAARNNRWFLAGLLGACASFTRVNGLLLLPVLGVEILYQWWQTKQWRWEWLWIGVVPLGFIDYLLVNYVVTGDPFAFQKIVREHWYKSLTWPWTGIWNTISSLSWRSRREVWSIFVPELVFMELTFLATIISFVKLRPSYAVWMASNWLLITSTSFILSVPRYSLLLFPISILLARATTKRVWFVFLSAAAIQLLVLFTVLFVIGWGGY
jgi:Gpi18-like mannosyltransferase